jgi:Arylsulfotransferase (ASST)/Bacterial cadherin-like domain/RTX calcium-binding nonapeptide repeat (4 copies)/Bacterial Ig domain
MRRIRRSALPVLALLLAPSAAQSQPTANDGAKAGRVTCLGKPATLEASPEQRLLIGTPGADVIVGTSGPDQVRGRGGNDLVCGGGGSDLLAAGPGRDRLGGGPGNDLVLGGAGRDRLAGGSGDDHLDGGAGRDRCAGGADTNTYVSCEIKPNNPPSAGQLAVLTDEDTPVAIDVLAKAFDPDSDRLKLDVVKAGSGGGEVKALDGRVVQFDPAHRFDHLGSNQSATAAFTFTIRDGRGGSAEGAASVTIEGRDDRPLAADDAALLDENSDATFIDVLSNDTDIDGGAKTVESVTDPAHGTVSIAAGGAGLTYEPQAGYCNDAEAPDTFTYALNGGSVGTVAARVVCVTTVSSNLPLTPSFDPDVTNYTVRCTGDPLEVFGRAAEGTTVVVDGGEPATGKFDATVPLEENQSFGFTTTAGSDSKSYSVRCLPADFPVWDYEQVQPSSQELYVVAPNLGGSPGQYVVIFDSNGVPVWWYTEPGGTLQDAKVLSNGTLAWWKSGGGYVIREADGTLVQGVVAVGFTDGHELQQTPNGNFLLISNDIREGVDLTEYGGTADEDVEDMVVQEVSPGGDLVWSWNTNGRIGLAETGRWWPTVLSRPEPRDIIHMNAIEPVGEDAVLISVRHTDAIYKVDKATGNVIWKLGGTWTPKSLQVLKDPEAAYPFGGPHDVRLLPDGTITVYDNNTGLGVPPRATRYAIDEGNRTATLVEQVTDPLAPSSFCCGSSRRSDDGSWLMSWGGRSLVSEYDSAGEPNFRLRFGGTVFSYRAVPVDDGALSVASLSAAMDVMHPR